MPAHVPSPDLLGLPAELLFAVAIHSPIRALRLVVRFDARLVACVRVQRWYRCRSEPKNDTCLSVGDRVLVRDSAYLRGMRHATFQYATAAAKVQGGMLWKLCLTSDEYVIVPASRIRKLQDWADGPGANRVGVSAAVTSASRARGAATNAAAAAGLAMHSGISSAEAALAIAAATATSTAAAAATAASSVVAPTIDELRHEQEARELLSAAQQMREAIVAGTDVVAPRQEHASAALARAASAATEAVIEADAAASAAEAAAADMAATSEAVTADALGALVLTASTAASAANQVFTAVTALEAAPSSSPAAVAAEAAAGALMEVGAAGLALSSALASRGGGGCTTSAPALDVTQAAAQVLLEAVPVSDVLNVALTLLPAASAVSKVTSAKASLLAEEAVAAKVGSAPLEALASVELCSAAAEALAAQVERSVATVTVQTVQRGRVGRALAVDETRLTSVAKDAPSVAKGAPSVEDGRDVDKKVLEASRSSLIPLGVPLGSTSMLDAARARSAVPPPSPPPSKHVVGSSASLQPEPVPVSEESTHVVPMPTRDEVYAFLKRVDPATYCSTRAGSMSARASADRQAALDDITNGLLAAMRAAACRSPSGQLHAVDCPLLFSDEDSRNVWALNGRQRAASRTVELPLAGVHARIEQRWRDEPPLETRPAETHGVPAHGQADLEDDLEDDLEGHSTTGVCWDGAVVLADLLCHHPAVLAAQSPNLARRALAPQIWTWEGKVVVELGCGTSALPRTCSK